MDNGFYFWDSPDGAPTPLRHSLRAHRVGRNALFEAQWDMLSSMNLTLAHIGARPGSKDEFDALTAVYLGRCSAFARCKAQAFRSEEALLDWLERHEGAQQMVFAVGPASGWSDAARARAQLLLSLGPMTLAHSLARLVMAEQIYRAYAILTGHPYHAGH